MQSTILYLLLALFIAGFGALLYLVIELKRKAEKPADDGGMKVMMEWMKEIKSSSEKTRETMDQTLSQTTKSLNERLDAAARYIADMKKEMGGISQIGPDIRRLSETLASPKMRGNFGEEMLEGMLSQVLPKSAYRIQYKFKNGEAVDACVTIGERILSIDSKFTMENFRLYKEAKDDETAETLKKAFLKDVKKRVDEIHKKYILPQEKTFDFALMYVPSEGIYHEIIDSQEVLDYCRKQSVIPVGPNSLFIYLRNIVISLRGQEINNKAQEILQMIAGIKQESDKFGRNLEVLGNHIKNAGNTMGTVTNDFSKLKVSISNAATLQLEETKEIKEQTLEAQKLIE